MHERMAKVVLGTQLCHHSDTPVTHMRSHRFGLEALCMCNVHAWKNSLEAPRQLGDEACVQMQFNFFLVFFNYTFVGGAGRLSLVQLQ